MRTAEEFIADILADRDISDLEQHWHTLNDKIRYHGTLEKPNKEILKSLKKEQRDFERWARQLYQQHCLSKLRFAIPVKIEDIFKLVAIKITVIDKEQP